MSRLGKHPRTKGAYFDQLDDGDDDVTYEDIHVREGRLKKTGPNTVAETLPIHVAVLDDASSVWMNMASWKVSDDTDLALDPSDGRLYDEAVNRHVMDDRDLTSGTDDVQVEKKRYIRSKVSVSALSVCVSVLEINQKLNWICDKSETAACRLEGCTQRHVSQ